MNAATSIAMAQSRQSTDSLKSLSTAASDDKQKSSSAEASANKGRFTKTSEDRNGHLRFTNGQIIIGKRRRLLLVGTGIRQGQENAKDQAVFAVHTVGDGGMKACQYYWQFAGQETKARYTDVKRWMPGFWKEQISNSMLTDEESRMGRIWNIFHGETLDQAMATRFDPTTLVGHRKIDVEARPDLKRKAVDTSNNENEDDKAKRAKKSSSTPAPIAKMSANSPTQWPNSRMAEAASSVHNEKPVLKQSDISLSISLRFDKTEEDLDVDLDLMPGKTCGPNNERVGLLHVGMGTRTGSDTTDSQAIFVRMMNGINSYGSVNYYWGPNGKETRAFYEDVEHWLRGFWKNQISGLGMTDEQARAVRVRALYTGVETIQDAMTTRLNPSTVELMQNMKRTTEKSVLDARVTLNNGLWKEQVSGHGKTEKAARDIRIRNICQDKESIGKAMITPFDPYIAISEPKPSPRPTKLNPPVQHRSTRGRFVTNDNIDADIPQDVDSEYEEMNLMPDNTDDDDYTPMLDLLPTPSSKPTPVSSSPSQNRSIDQVNSLPFAKTPGDIDRKPWLAKNKVINGHTKQMLAVGTNKNGVVMFASRGTSGKRRITYHLGYTGPRASSDDVAYWFRGFWENQCVSNVTARALKSHRHARSARAVAIFEGYETIEQAMRTTMASTPSRNQVTPQSEGEPEDSGVETEEEDERCVKVTEKLAIRTTTDTSTTWNNKQASSPLSILSPQTADDIDKIPYITTGRVMYNDQKRRMIAVGESADGRVAFIDLQTPTSCITTASSSDETIKNPSRIISFPYAAPQAAMMPTSTPTPTLSVSTETAPTMPISTTSISADAITTSCSPIPAAVNNVTSSMTFDEAYAIFSDEQNIKRSPQEIQTAISVLAGSTPPLKLIQQAIFALRVGKIQSIYDFEGLRKFLQECDMM